MPQDKPFDAFILPPPPCPSVAVFQSDQRFAVRRIFCVGHNYDAHAAESTGTEAKAAPFFFSKPNDAVVDDNETIPYPSLTKDLHHEAELVVAIGFGGSQIAPEQARAHIWGYGVGNDLTRRDLQASAKAKGKPWSMSKGFDNSAPVGPLVPIGDCPDMTSGAIRAVVNGETRQSGDLRDMVWGVPDIIAALSKAVDLEVGDLIFTGTPAGVGPLLPGDICEIEIDGLPKLTTRIAP